MRLDRGIALALGGAVLLGLLLGLWATAAPGAVAVPAPPTPYAATVAKVIDGDTLDVRRATGQTVRIRLAGIDAPEKAQPCGPAARERLAALAPPGAAVIVHPLGVRTYNREVAWVATTGEDPVDLSMALVEDGYAWRLPGKPCYPHCRALDRAAARARQWAAGCWQQGPIEMPWEYRARIRQKR